MSYQLTSPIIASGYVTTRISFHRRARMTVARIQEAVTAYYDLAPPDMVSQRRSRHISRPRQIAMYLTRELTPKSLPDIGRRFGGRDHTTVIHAIKQVERLIGEDADIANDVELLREGLAPYSAQWSVG